MTSHTELPAELESQVSLLEKEHSVTGRYLRQLIEEAIQDVVSDKLSVLFPEDGKYECWREGDEVYCANLANIKLGTEISTAQAAKILGVTDRHIRRLIKEKKIRAVRRDEKEWKVIAESLSQSEGVAPPEKES